MGVHESGCKYTPFGGHCGYHLRRNDLSGYDSWMDAVDADVFFLRGEVGWLVAASLKCGGWADGG